MKRKSLITPVDSISEFGSEHKEHGSSLGSLAFPGVKNPTGLLLDRLSVR